MSEWNQRHLFCLTFEPPHDKTTKWHVCPAKTQISLGICPVWSESSLCAHLVAILKDLSFLYADSKDSDQTGRIPKLIWVFAMHTCHFVGFVMRRLRLKYTVNLLIFAAINFQVLLMDVILQQKFFMFPFLLWLDMDIPSFRGNLFSWKFLPCEYRENKSLSKLNRFTVMSCFILMLTTCISLEQDKRYSPANRP